MLTETETFFRESMERLAGGLGVTFEGVSVDWIAGADPTAPTQPGPSIFTADGWRPLTPAPPIK